MDSKKIDANTVLSMLSGEILQVCNKYAQQLPACMIELALTGALADLRKQVCIELATVCAGAASTGDDAQEG